MKRSIIVLSLLVLLCLPGSLYAAEIFEEYPRKFALGYDSSPLIRYWFSNTWGMDIRPDYRTGKDTDDGYYAGYPGSSFREDVTYFIQINGVYQLRSFPYADYNLLFGINYRDITGNTQIQSTAHPYPFIIQTLDSMHGAFFSVLS